MAEETEVPAKDAVIPIEIRLTDIMQMFNSLDPAPFHEKELDHDAESYIVSTMGDFPFRKRFRLVIQIPEKSASPETAETLEHAIRNHFLYRADAAQRQFRFEMRLGRISLLIGLTFLVICLTLRHILVSSGNPFLNPYLSEGLLIIGWVAMWGPVTTFLYGLYPIIRQRNMYRKIAGMEIEICPYPPGPDGPGFHVPATSPAACFRYPAR
jgi:hypothetical protein